MKLMVCWNWVEYHQLYFDEIFRLEKVLIVQPQQQQRKDLMLKCYKYHSRGSPVWIKYEILQFNTTFFLECWAKFENILCSFLFSDMGTMLEYESTGNKYYFFHGSMKWNSSWRSQTWTCSTAAAGAWQSSCSLPTSSHGSIKILYRLCE